MKKPKPKKGKKRKLKLKLKGVFALLFFVAILAAGAYYVYRLRIQNIYVLGTTLVKDAEIINAANIKDYPEIYHLNIKEMEQNISNLAMVDTAKIKRSLTGKITIEVKENRILFYNRNNNKVVLSNGEEIDLDPSFTGLPVLINFVPDNIYKDLIKNLVKVEPSLLKAVSEMEYSQSKSDNVVIDDTRFFFRMNDGNLVQINLINITHLNRYQKIISGIGEELGVLYLDSSNSENFAFRTYKSLINSGEGIPA